jgi:hypothetical protein
MNPTKLLLSVLVSTLLISGCKKSEPTNGTQGSTPQQTSGTDTSASTQPTPGNNGNATNQQAPGTDANAMSQQTQQPAPPPEPPPPFVVPAGTSFSVILGSTLNSRVNDAGEEFAATVATPVMVGEEVAIPKGADVRGVITRSKKQGTFKGAADLAIMLTSLRINGKSYPISTSTYAESVKGKGKRTGAMAGGGAVVGALIGGLAGGGKGAAIGAGVGGGGGLAAAGATGGENVTLAAESRVRFKLVTSVTIDRSTP